MEGAHFRVYGMDLPKVTVFDMVETLQNGRIVPVHIAQLNRKVLFLCRNFTWNALCL